MEAESRYTFVGAAVLGLIAALVVSVLWLKNLGSRDYERFAIYFEQQALDGLDVGAAVSLRGIQVGRVEDYALSGDLGERVRVVVRIDGRVPVRTNTVAVVTRNFVTGIAAIALINRQPPGEPLTQAVGNETLPVIGEGRSDLDEIAGRVNKVGEVATDAMANMAQLLNAQNRATLMAAVASLRDLAVGLNERLATLDKTLSTVTTTAAEVGTAMQSAGRAAHDLGDAGQRIAVVVEHSGRRLDGTLAQSDETLAEARRALAQVASAADVVQRQAASSAQRLETTMVGIDDQLRAAVAELRLSTEAATRSLDRLREPRAALLGPSPAQLGPGEVLP
jgi:phospholipid/cholesterol/gamma-HCH transport system substrate-binding protein